MVASARFGEHYGWSVHRATFRRVTLQRAHQARTRLDSQRQGAREAFFEPLSERCGVERMLVELDGSLIRTGVLKRPDEGEPTAVRRLRSGRRWEEWKEVRVGLARPLASEASPRYVARKGDYPEVVSELFDAAVSEGLSLRSETIAVADGGIGLKEELETQFEPLTFILDRPHLQSPLAQTAEAMGLNEWAREAWRRQVAQTIDAGGVREVIRQLRSYQGMGEERVGQLAGYLHRFRDCVHYEAYQERGFPIGSGAVESAHRFIPQKRLKLPGACWHPDSINPMLALRVLRANGEWESLWQQESAA